MDLIDISGQSLLFGVVATVVIIAVNGFLIAGFARLLGEPGPSYDGKLTINPLAHLEIVGALALVLTPLGWIRPPALDGDKLRWGVLGALALVLLSLGSMFFLAWGLWALRPSIYAIWPSSVIGTTLIGLVETTARKAVSFGLFNLVPILPLTAGMVWAPLAPSLYALQERRLRIIAIVLGVTVVSGLPQRAMAPAARAINTVLFG